MLKQLEPSAGAETAPRSAPRPHAMNRAIADLRCGDFVVLHDGERAALLQAAESVEAETLAQAIALSGTAPLLATTRRRALALGLAADEPAEAVQPGPRAVELHLPLGISAERLNALADPTLIQHDLPAGIEIVPAAPHGLAAAAIELAKLSRLLPAMVLHPLRAREADALARREGIIALDVATVCAHRSDLAHTMRRVVDAQVPLADAERATIVAFRPDDGGIDHLAILIGAPAADQPVLARIHSECFTGDLLGSLRCDCGEQLRGAIKTIAESGGGVLIYLAQEGRGIGLINKLRAYRLQDAGFDTVDANEQLGFEADERTYQPAAEMLRLLGFSRVRLLTNNPEKVAALARHGIEVVERVPSVFAANDHNRHYLATKAKRSGHLF